MPPQIKPQDRRTGATLRALRVGVGLSQSEMVARVVAGGGELSKTALSNYENGSRVPNNGALFAILDVIATELHAKVRAVA